MGQVYSPVSETSGFKTLSEVVFWVFLNFIYFIFGCVGSSLLAFSSCGERGLLFVAVRRLLIAVAFLVAEHEL